MTASIPAFANNLPVKIRFGEGVSHQLPEVLAEVGATKVLVMLDEGAESFNPEVATLVEHLRANCGAIAIDWFHKPGGEPTIDQVDEATAALVSSGAQVVVAIGGGSIMDTAKAARLCADRQCTFAQYLAEDRTVPVSQRALICLPTSAGTGSEVSGGSVISDPASGTKAGIASPLMRAQYALVDPRLTYSVPATMTAHTGIDALAQAIAGMVAKCRTPIGDGIALEAIRMIGRSLVAAYRDGSDTAARADMACGSMMAGLTMNIADCTAEHSLGQALGGMKHVPHGLTIGLVLVQTLDRERAHVPEQLERVADALGVPADGTHDGSRAIGAIEQILKDLNFPVLRDISVTEQELEPLTDLALADYFITQSPAPWSRQEVLDAFTAAYAITAR